MTEVKFSIDKLFENCKTGTIPKGVVYNGEPQRFIFPCQEWQGAKDNKGYGVMRTPEGLIVQVHEVSYYIRWGSFDSNITHKCKNKLCVNPTHLTTTSP